MAEVSQNTKYVRLDDGVSFSLVRTNPKLTTNTKLMYNGKKMYMESYVSSDLMNTSTYKNVSVIQNSKYNKDIASFLTGTGKRAYDVHQNFSDIAISDSYDNQFETLYWCGAEYIDSSFYTEEIGFVAPLYLREKMPNYFLIFRLDTPSNYNFTENSLDSIFDFKTDILDKAVLIKTFDLREGSVLGNYIHSYIDQESFEFDKSIYVNFSNGEVTYFGINKSDGVLEKKVENFEHELLKDSLILKDDKWFTEGFERNNLIFPYIMNIEYLFDDETFMHKDGELYDFARYIGIYCNNIEFGEFTNLDELSNSEDTQDNVIYYFEDNNKNLHRYSLKTISESSESEIESELMIDGKDSKLFDESLISGFENERITGYAEPLDIYEGFINRGQYGFEILKPLEPGDWIGIEYDGHVECYFADNKTISAGEKHDMLIGEYSDFRFSVSENSTLNDIAEALVKSVNRNKKSKFEAVCVDNVVAFYAKREGKEYNNAKMLIEASLLYNEKISLPISKDIKHVNENVRPIEHISSSDKVNPAVDFDSDGNIIGEEQSSFGDYYMDNFSGACNVDIDPKTDTYKNVFKIYKEEHIFFEIDRYLKTNNGDGRKICTNMIYINTEGKIDSEYRLVIIDDVSSDKVGDEGYDVSVSSTYQVEIMDKFKPNHGILSWFPVKDFDFDMNYSIYGQYGAFADECKTLSKKYSDVKNDSNTTNYDSLLSLSDIILTEDNAETCYIDDDGNGIFEYYVPEGYESLSVYAWTGGGEGLNTVTLFLSKDINEKYTDVYELMYFEIIYSIDTRKLICKFGAGLYGDAGSSFEDASTIRDHKVTILGNKETNGTNSTESISMEEDMTYVIQDIAKSPFSDGDGNALETEYDYFLEQYHPDLCLMSKTTPYILKWGYYDEQKDSCENPYRLNVNKVFGVSNLSANTYLRNCDVNEYTHSMPYYMTMGTPDYYKDYQYIETDEIYGVHYDESKNEQYMINIDGVETEFKTLFDCVEYWVNDVFKRTDVDMFSKFFSGKKYGKRFDRKYSRLLGGDKFHNPSTLFRGVKFEAVRQYNGVEKRSSEYNDYKFSFVYIPVMLDSLVFNSTIHFVKNDTFKFIVGIIFVNTMLGKYDHNIFDGSVDYFNKGFLYAACKDIIRPEIPKNNDYILTLSYYDKNNEDDVIKRKKVPISNYNMIDYYWDADGSNINLIKLSNSVIEIEFHIYINGIDFETGHSEYYYTKGDATVIFENGDDYGFIRTVDDRIEVGGLCFHLYTPEYKNDGEGTYGYIVEMHSNIEKVSVSDNNGFWSENYNTNITSNEYYMWIGDKRVLVTKTQYITNNKDIIGEFGIDNGYDDGSSDYDNGYGIENIDKPKESYTIVGISNVDKYFEASWNNYYEEYDAMIYRHQRFEYYGKISCEKNAPNLEFYNNVFTDICDIEWSYFDDYYNLGYIIDISEVHFKSESLQNILINMGNEDSVVSIKFYNVDGVNGNSSIIDSENGVVEFRNEGEQQNAEIKVDIYSGNITIKPYNGNTILKVAGINGESIENLKMDIIIKDKFDDKNNSLALKDYFSVFNQLSAHSITEYINSDYNVKYYSTVEDNKYKIRVIEPDSIEVEDKYEVYPVKITQNNKSVIGSVEIKEKMDVDKIGIKVINRYSGYYNPIFNDILYYGDYTYTKTYSRLRNVVQFELPYSNTNIDYKYSDGYGEFGVIKNMYYHKTNISRSNSILTSERPVYPAINEYALDYRDYNIFSSSWDEGYFISQDDLDTRSICEGIGSMKDSLCMFGSKYLNLPDYIFIDTFENGKLWDEKLVIDIRDNTDIEMMYKEVDNRSVIYHLFIEKRLKRYLKESLMDVFSKYINKKYSFGNKGTIEDDVEEYVEKNLLKLYKVDRVYMYIKSERMSIRDKMIENEYLKYVDKNNDDKIEKYEFPYIDVNGGKILKDSKFRMDKLNEFDRSIVYNLKPGFKESFGFGVSFRRK